MPPAMQRVSSLLPSWDKRNSQSNGTSTTKQNGFFGWGSSRHSLGNGTNGAAHPAAKGLANINVTAANAGNRVHREAFWPATLDLECVKAARILKSFCGMDFLKPVQCKIVIGKLTPSPADGYLAPVEDTDESSAADPTEPQTPVKITKHIPKRVIQNAAGIAVFTCMRSGLWMTGSGGSGILIARKSDGTWSPPSGIMLHTPTLSFIIGVDVYDCVLVVTNLKALESITRSRVTLGDEIDLRNGPSIPKGADEVNLNWSDLDNSVLAYMKARGQHQAVNLQGCILTERANENERFYGGNVNQMQILAGNVARHVEETKPLFEVIKMAEGRTDFDTSVIDRTAIEPAPGDVVIATPRSASASASGPTSPHLHFGIPKTNDPDPFGVLALEMAGMEIREAGTRLRPASSQFEVHSNPLSPTLSKFSRQSVDTHASKNNRTSVLSTRTTQSQTTDAGTQTSTGNTPETSPSPGHSDDSRGRASIDRIAEMKDDEVDYTTVDLSPLRHLSREHEIDLVLPEEEPAPTPPPRSPRLSKDRKRLEGASSPLSKELERENIAPLVVEKSAATPTDGGLVSDTNDADDEEDMLESDEEEPVVFEVAQVQPTSTRAVASRVIHAKGSVVNIPKRLPPPLPKRSPARHSANIRGEAAHDALSVHSPLRQAFSEADLKSPADKSRDSKDDKDMLPQSRSADVKAPISAGDESIVEESLPADQTEGEQAATEQSTEVIDEGALLKVATETPLPNAKPADADLAAPSEDFANTKPSINSEIPQTQDAEEAPEDEERTPIASPEAVVPTRRDSTSVYGEEADQQDNNDLGPTLDDTESDYASLDDRSMEDNESVTTPHETDDHTDSASRARHTSSVYTGLTEDRWSLDASSVTTPTSGRAASVEEYNTEEDTPKKLDDQDEDELAPLDLQKTAEGDATTHATAATTV